MVTRPNKITKHVTAKELEDYSRIAIYPNDIYDKSSEDLETVSPLMFWIKDGAVFNRINNRYYNSPFTLSSLAQYLNMVIDGGKGFIMGAKKEKTSMKGKRTTVKKTVRKPVVRKTVRKTKRA